jgi:DAK2 domain fusion protein YloV
MKSIDAKKLVTLINKAYELLDEKKAVVDELNVFPVPDGDTGTNMTMSMKSGVERVNSSDMSTVESVSKALSQGTLMGARGNSGVILSQLCRGMSKALKGKEVIGPEEIKDIFAMAKQTAYKAVMQPTEGTILTVCRIMSEKADKSFDPDIDIDEYLFLIAAEGQKALLNTPNQLEVLKEAGVVDSGGQGLMFLVEGAVKALNSDFDLGSSSKEEMPKHESKEYEISLEILLDQKEKESFEEKLNNISAYQMTGFENGILKASFETNDLTELINLLKDQGKLIKLDILNINSEIKEMVKKANKPKKKYGFIAVSRGEGYDNVFESLNVDYIIPGGQTMNPSTEDIFKAIESVDAENIFIFPNNKNIIMSAKQACQVADVNCRVIETRSIPESFSAILAFDENDNFEENIENMNEILEDLKVCEVTISIRDTKVNNIEIKKDDYIGIAEGDIVTSKNSIDKTAIDCLDKIVDEETSLITIYYGKDITDKEAKKLHKSVSKKYKGVDVELVYGGQPLYYYTITLE